MPMTISIIMYFLTFREVRAKYMVGIHEQGLSFLQKMICNELENRDKLFLSIKKVLNFALLKNNVFAKSYV